MSSLFLSGIFAALIAMGFSAAFAAGLGFIWVDIVKPQQLATSIIADLPLSMVAAVILLLQYFINDRKHPPKFTGVLLLITLFALWVTLTTSMSVIPVRPWHKWDWAIKVLIFAVFFPYIFRSRVQIEAFILVFIFSAGMILFPAGLKTLAGGGGYGVLAVMGSGNSGLSESSTLAMVCVMIIPLIWFSMRYSIIIPRNRYTALMFLGLIGAALACVVGTTARTGLIAVAVLAGTALLKSRRKLWWIAGGAVVAVIVANIDLSSTNWGSRMSTIETYNQDSSALGRLKVWEWTLGFVASNPMGGGFDAYALNKIAGVLEDGTVYYYPEWQLAGKAFHSIYFEVLGEQGIPGFLIYFSIIIATLLTLRKLKKKWRDHSGMAWLVGLSDALSTSILIFLTGGAFVGIAYQPYIFYMVSLTVAIDQYSRRVEQDLKTNTKGRPT